MSAKLRAVCARCFPSTGKEETIAANTVTRCVPRQKKEFSSLSLKEDILFTLKVQTPAL